MNRHGTDEGEALVRLALATALHETGDAAAAAVAIAAARDHLLERAAKVTASDMRASFLENVPENAGTMALAAAWLTEAPGG